MESIYIHLEHCYGIPSFDCTFQFDNDKKKAHLIYAPNGTMKSSFAHTLSDICADPPAESRERYFHELPYTRVVKHGSSTGTDLEKDEIFVVESRHEYFTTEKMSLFLANEDLKARYDLVHYTILEKFGNVSRLLNSLSAKRDAKSIFCSDFHIQDKEFFESLCELFHEYEGKIIPSFQYIKYGKLFTDEVEKLLSSPEVIEKLDRYIDQYSHLLLSSTLFRPVFNHTSAEDILTRLENSGFFRADHKVSLNGFKEPLNGDEFKELIVKEKNRIVNEELAKEFNEIDALLGAKNATTDFRTFLFEHKEVIPFLRELSAFKKAIWISYLFSKPELLAEAVTCFEESKLDIEKIVHEAEGQKTEWEEVVDEFNGRFINMPFILKVGNKEDVILEEKAPTLEFLIKTGDTAEPYKTVERELLLTCLSEGERRAFFLLNVMFEIRALKKRGKRTLIVFDDIADSFDYKNKYAIIEYVIDIINDEIFLPIILTHNFDFYRTLSERAGIQNGSHLAQIESGQINIEKRGYTKNVFYSWSQDVYSNQEILIAAIPFVRNLVEYIKGQENHLYLNLTSLLHYKKNRKGDILKTEEITLAHLVDWFECAWGLDRSQFHLDPEQKVVDLMLRLALEINANLESSILLERKIIMSIAIRLITEKFMISQIVNRTGSDSLINEISKNQTRELMKLCEFDINDDKDLIRKKIVEQVLIMTSENIHINSFMYEPLIDMSLDELKKLYEDVSHEFGWKD